MNSNNGCIVCGSDAIVKREYGKGTVLYICPICGRFQLTHSALKLARNNKLASYLYYNRFDNDIIDEYRYHTTLSKVECDKYRKAFDEGNLSNGRPVHMDADIINNWYPKSFAERIDRILLKVSELSGHIGKSVTIAYPELLSLLFVDRRENGSDVLPSGLRDSYASYTEAQYMVDVLKTQNLIKVTQSVNLSDGVDFVLTPNGYARVDELQKNTSLGRQALVAMAFNDDTVRLREAIRKGIQAADYTAVFIDEVQHNDFITPELLKHIRDSKFVVADLTHQNNGAYFEEGYAMGLGKPVIQLCKIGTKLHFDIAQKNTIMWETEDDIPLRLENRIRATID